MSWFKKNNEEDTPRPRNDKAVLMIRAVAAAYMFYLAYDMVNMYLTGTEQAELWLVIVGTAFLAAGGIFIALITWRDWKAYKKKEAEEQLAAQEEAEKAEGEEAEELPEGEETEEAPAETEE